MSEGHRSPAALREIDGGDKLGANLARLARRSLFTVSGAASGAFLGYVLIVVVTRGLGAARAGVFFEAVALYSIVSVVGELGADDGLVRTIPRYRALGRVRDLRRLLAVSLMPVFLMGLLLGAALLLFAPQLSHLFLHGREQQRQALIPYLRVLAFFIPLDAVAAVMLSGTRGFNSMRPFVLIGNWLRPGLRPVLAAAVISLSLGTTALALAYVVPDGIAFVCSLIALIGLLGATMRRDGPRSEPPHPVGEIAGELWRFSAPRAFAAFFAIALSWLDTLLLGGLRGARDAGIYATATRYLTIGMVAIQAVQLVMGPVMSSLLSRREHQRAHDLFRIFTQWLVLGAWPIYLTMAVFAPTLLRAFGSEFESGATALMLLSLAALVMTGVGPTQTMLLMAGRSGWTLANSVVALSLNVGLNLLWIPPFGINGAAAAWAVSILVNNVASVIELRFIIGLLPFSKDVNIVGVVAAISFGGLGVIMRSVFGSSLPAFLAFLGGASALYGLLLFLFRSHLNLPVLREVARIRGQRAPAEE
jgi:O-antigen/teichoic acid export membrane protein